ncbi:MAG: nickel pincer cofactor-dependent isomerase, group 22 [Pirellulaceae bacterium]
MSSYPRVFRIRQQLPRPRVDDVAAAVAAALESVCLARSVRPGQRVAVTAGSRGIANMAVILHATVRHLQQLGAEPFIVPAMGSHGGATAAGQQRILASYGITEASCGCPIRSSMETVIVCQSAEGFPVHFDRCAFEADHVLVCGRVKPHTRFVGDIESGLMKMLLIGLGKHAGARVYHQAIQDFNFGQIVRSVAREVLQRCHIVAGLAIVENAYDETALIAAVAPDEFEARERELLRQARQWMPKLPFDGADLLLIDEIGKDVSGAGLDTNVVGRKFLEHTSREDEYPKIKYIVVRGLTEVSAGNATGIGLVEFCRSHIVREMDVHATRTNCLTGSHATAAMIPLDYETDREILDVALSVIGLRPPASARLMWIQNTLKITEMECSEAYFEAARERSDLEILTQPRKLPLRDDGQLPSIAAWQ